MNIKYIFFITNALAFAFISTLVKADENYTLVPHNAIYELNLANTKQGSNIYSIRGTMQTEWLEECNSWVFNQHTILDIGSTLGENSRSEYVFSTLENKESTNYKFLARSFSEGVLEEKIQGFATKNTNGSKVIFDSPVGKGYELPNNTLFPIAHYKAIMDMIKNKQSFKNFTVFSGDRVDSLENVSVVIFPISKNKQLIQKKSNVFKDKSFISIRLAYFDYFSKEEYPSLEISADLASNGIASNIRIDYPEFSIIGDLKDVSLIERKRCAD